MVPLELEPQQVPVLELLPPGQELLLLGLEQVLLLSELLPKSLAESPRLVSGKGRCVSVPAVKAAGERRGFFSVAMKKSLHCVSALTDRLTDLTLILLIYWDKRYKAVCFT